MNYANVEPRVIIHGGSGNMTRSSLPRPQWDLYRLSLLRILQSTNDFLTTPVTEKNDRNALDAAVHAVQQLEEDPLFNAGKGAVFTRLGTIELEASVMVSRGYRKRGIGVSLIKRVKSPISLAAEILKRGEEYNGGGASGHAQLSGEAAEELALKWGLEMCSESYYWTKQRWDEHKRGLKEISGNDITSSDESEEHIKFDSSLPLGTVGAVVLDRYGTLAVATSTGGLTNKLPGRIGDTPSLGAGFWAEQWLERRAYKTFADRVMQNLVGIEPFGILKQCVPGMSWQKLSQDEEYDTNDRDSVHAVAMSGTGNGDSFLKLDAVRTTAALLRFSSTVNSLQSAVSWMTGPNGQLTQSAGDRWGKTGEGLGGIIGIDFQDGAGKIVMDFNKAMFRAWIDDQGRERCMVFRDEY